MKNTSLACVLLVIVVDEFICLNLSMYSKILKRFNMESAKTLEHIIVYACKLSNNEYPKSNDEKEFMRKILIDTMVAKD